VVVLLGPPFTASFNGGRNRSNTCINGIACSEELFFFFWHVEKRLELKLKYAATRILDVTVILTRAWIIGGGIFSNECYTERDKGGEIT
jgi:hypothetical protein